MSRAGTVSGESDADRLLAAGRKVARELALDGALVGIATALNEDGVRSLLLKGLALARCLYDDVSERAYGDTDLLVAPDQLAAAGRFLGELGYQRPEPGRPHTSRPTTTNRGSAAANIQRWSSCIGPCPSYQPRRPTSDGALRERPKASRSPELRSRFQVRRRGR